MFSIYQVLLTFIFIAAIAYVHRRYWSIPDMPQATLSHSICGNAPYFHADSIKYLLEQRAIYGDHVWVDLTVFRVAFFFSPEAVNAVMGAIEASGASLYKATNYFFGDSFMKSILLEVLLMAALDMSGGWASHVPIICSFVNSINTLNIWA